jgi:hypothetical protein
MNYKTISMDHLYTKYRWLSDYGRRYRNIAVFHAVFSVRIFDIALCHFQIWFCCQVAVKPQELPIIGPAKAVAAVTAVAASSSRAMSNIALRDIDFISNL